MRSGFTSVVRAAVCGIVLGLAGACDNAPDIPSYTRESSEAEIGPPFAQDMASSPEQLAAEKALRDSGRILIDSVPRGALVSFLPNEGPNGAGRPMSVGETPVQVDPAQYPRGAFTVLMAMDVYVEALRAVPNLAAVADEVQARAGSGVGYGSQDIFQFDTPTSQVLQDGHQRLIAVGPVYNIDYERTDRIVALFIPRGASARAFFPLMPPDGTYELNKSRYSQALISDYGFSPEQAREAAESLARCGKYVAMVESFRPTGGPALVTLSVQRGGIMTSVSEPRR